MIKAVKASLPLRSFRALHFVRCFGAGARAADDGSSAKIDFSQSGPPMIDILKSVEAPVMTGDVDTDFAAIALAHEKRTAKLMKIEAACGKSAKMRASASRAPDDSAERVVRYQTQLGSH